VATSGLDFAHEFGLPIIEVVAGGDISQAAYSGDGEMVNSDYLNRLSVASAKEAITERLATEGRRRRVEYNCTWHPSPGSGTGRAVPDRVRHRRPSPPLPESALPVELPDVRTTRRCCSIPTTPTAAVAATGQGDRLGAWTSTSATG
jgi:leucyl-tRNA synthetase